WDRRGTNSKNISLWRSAADPRSPRERQKFACVALFLFFYGTRASGPLPFLHGEAGSAFAPCGRASTTAGVPGRGNGPASGDPALDPRRAAFGRAGPVQRARARAGRKEEAEAEEDPFRCSSSSVTARL
ncbi:unnamed protein product, partial [Prorocentrum cordatum]